MDFVFVLAYSLAIFALAIFKVKDTNTRYVCIGISFACAMCAIFMATGGN